MTNNKRYINVKLRFLKIIQNKKIDFMYIYKCFSIVISPQSIQIATSSDSPVG